MKSVIFLGAGASAAEGGATQNALFRDYFRSRRHGERQDMFNELAALFQTMFAIDVKGPLRGVEFPSFEEVLGLLDIARLRGEAFRGFSSENIGTNSNRIGFIRQYLVLMMGIILRDGLSNVKGLHDRLIKNLQTAGSLRNVSFVTTNYDILSDNAIARLGAEETAEMIDYGIDELYIFRSHRHQASPDALPLYKIHGSLNWLYCPVCNSLSITPGEKGILCLVDQFENARCSHCQSVISPLIVPPTFFKNMNNVFLSTVWRKLENALCEADHVIFCGYSFPDADMHIKYILKRAQTNRGEQGRPASPLRFTVVNNYLGKNPDIARAEEVRFKRFLGADVNYKAVSFEAFCDNPTAYL